MRLFSLAALIAAMLVFVAPAAASSWPDAGGGPGNPGFQPTDPGAAPFSSAYSKTSGGDTWILTSPVVTGGPPATQRVAYGTLSGGVHLQSLLDGSPVGPEGGVSVDSAPVGDADLFTGAGNGLGNASFSVLDHAGGSRLLVLHNDDNQGGGIADIALAQIDVATGALVSDDPIPGSDGYTISSAPVLSDPDANGHRYLLFAASNGSGGWLGKIQIANATGSNPTLGAPSGLQVNNLNVLASPAIAYLNDALGNPTQYAVVSTTANGNNPTVVSFNVSDLSAGPASANLSAQAQTPSVPLTPAGLNPGSPGSGVATTPAIYVAAGASGSSRVHRLTQSGNSQTLANAPGTTLTGLPSQALALNQTTSSGSLSAGRIVVSTDANLYVIDATTLAVVATHSPTSLTAGSTGFLRNEPTIAGNNIFISRDNGDSLVLGLSDAQPISGFSENPGNANAIVSYGRPAVARWHALFVSDRGLFAYETGDTDSPTSSLTTPAHGATVSGTVSLSALAGDARGVASVVFRVAGSPVATVTSPTSGDPYSPGGAVYDATFDTTTLPDGPYLADVVATDAGGRTTASATHTVLVENTAPETTIDSGPPASSDDTSPTFEFSSTETGSTFECRIDGSAFAACTSPYAPGALALGDHIFEVRAMDASANTDPTPASRSFAIVAPPEPPPLSPTSSLTTPANGATISGTVALSAVASDAQGVASVVFRVAGSPVATVTNSTSGDPYDPAGAVYDATFDTTTLPDGPYLADVVATDAGGRTTVSATHTVLVENTAPETTIDSGPPASSDTSPTFTFSSSQGASSFECRIDGEAFAFCESPYSPGPLALGGHVFEVRATDAAANTDPTPASRSFAIVPPPDTQAPDTTLDSGPAASSEDVSPTFGFSSIEPGATFECSVDGGVFAPCTSPHSPGELALGDHVFEVRATDASGNPDPTPASHSFAIVAAPQPPPPLRVTMEAINMTPTGRINLPVACPARSANGCAGVVSLWAWFLVPHPAGTAAHSSRSHKPAAGDREPSYRHKRRRRRVGRKEFNVTAGKTQRMPMTLSARARQRACQTGRLPVSVIVRHKVGDEWRLSRDRVVLKTRRCQSR